ncbi:Uu.00g010680.m01.CDS01 [Anthostomella pinea]|uniref:Uu.00g010680.m01.CDS01 n=1 Tax=Anthostomella pinea TaxID=933095 RepID=A0AAI8YPY9_9PEZI|nr:Uu.00g010680.m01.CDS01 [Anthostomella pinea]
MPCQPCFLGLPREVRDGIYGLVPLAQCQAASAPPAPPAPSSSSELIRRANTIFHHRVEPYDISDPAEHLYAFSVSDAQPLVNPALSLLLVNHQVHHETKQALDWMAKKPQDLYLDVIFCKATDCLWATWLSVPCLASRYRNFYVKVRHFDQHELLGSEAQETDSSHTSHEGRILTKLLSGALCTYLQGGTLAHGRPASDSAGFTAEHLLLDFFPNPHEDTEDDEDTGDDEETVDDEVTEDWGVIDYALDFMWELGWFTRPIAAVTPFYERIGNIRSVGNGAQFQLQRFDLSYNLGRYFNQPNPDSDIDPIKWRDATIRKRQEAGLPTEAVRPVAHE